MSIGACRSFPGRLNDKYVSKYGSSLEALRKLPPEGKNRYEKSSKERM